MMELVRIFCLLLPLAQIVCTRPQNSKPSSNSTSAAKPASNNKREALNPIRFMEGLTTNRTKTRILTHPGNPNRGNFFGDSSDQDIVFPDSFESFDPIPRITSPPKCAEGLTFCESFESYPYNVVKEVLTKKDLKTDLFGKDEAPIEITNRIGEEEENFLCSSISRTIYPKIGKTKSNKWKYIVNQDEDGFVQGVRVETCRNQSKPCELIGKIPEGYVTSCKQKYLYRRLLSLTDRGTLIPDAFQLPSACCCSYKKNLDFLARFGSPVTPAV